MTTPHERRLPARLVLATLALPPAAALVFAPTASTAATIELAEDRARTDEVQVMEVVRRGDSVTGTLVNRSDAQIRDIRLLIDMPFLWTNEVKPGDDSPGRSAVLTVAGPLEPRGKLAFEFTPNPPLPERTDGRFSDPQAHVLGYQTITLR